MKKIKYILAIALLLGIFFQCSSPEAKINTEELKAYFNQDFEKYYSHLNSKNWEGIMDMTNPNVFKIASKEAMIGAFEQMEVMGLDLKVNNPQIIEFTDLIEFKDVFYTKIKYKANMEMILGESLAPMHKQMENELTKTYPKENIIYIEDESKFSIDSENYIVATSSDNKKTWTYFELNKSKEEMLQKIIPPVVYSEILKQ